MRAFLVLPLLLLMVSCGYKPTSHYTQQVLGEKVYTEVTISLEDPENSVLIKDAVNEAIVNQFHADIVPKDQADSKLYVTLKSVSFVPIQYDKNGYVIAYKTYVGMRTDYIDIHNKRRVINTNGDFDFPIESNSIISDGKRFEAIRFASEKAFDSLRSKIAIGAIK